MKRLAVIVSILLSGCANLVYVWERDTDAKTPHVIVWKTVSITEAERVCQHKGNITKIGGCTFGQRWVKADFETYPFFGFDFHGKLSELDSFFVDNPDFWQLKTGDDMLISVITSPYTADEAKVLPDGCAKAGFKNVFAHELKHSYGWHHKQGC